MNRSKKSVGVRQHFYLSACLIGVVLTGRNQKKLAMQKEGSFLGALFDFIFKTGYR
jgi:hypothetical protein